ncbi:hypothetical protein GOP47_0006209 [Adiantum capillus-veneris]|uniref:Uncharacterized protein n=1 Tax=Adiantum capillus-veneris TaxID=13818 RepID=A0A9D4V2M4_ADICA|nr:hypothetical protein GOP47_0006209 [Adiantum capillus-veneris]
MHNSSETKLCKASSSSGRTYIHNTGCFNCTSATLARQHYKLDSNIVLRLAQLDDIRTYNYQVTKDFFD